MLRPMISKAMKPQTKAAMPIGPRYSGPTWLAPTRPSSHELVTPVRFSSPVANGGPSSSPPSSWVRLKRFWYSTPNVVR